MSDALTDLVRTWLGIPVPPPVDGVERWGVVERVEDAPPGADVSPSPRGGQVRWRWSARVASWVPPALTYRRTVELRAFVGSGAQLLSTPTAVDGRLDADTLLWRLRQPPRPRSPVGPARLGTALVRLDPADRVDLEAAGAPT